MKTVLVLALLLATAALPAGSAPAPQMSAKTILDTTTTGTGQPIQLPGGKVRVIGLIVEIPPGYAPGYHRHPYPRYAYVLAGHLGVQDEHGATRTYGPGQLFIETLNGWHRPRVEGSETVKLLVIDQQPEDANQHDPTMTAASGFVTILGLAAGTLSTAAFVPQVLRIWKRRSASDISGFGVTVLAIGVALWMWYGIELGSLPIILANAVTLALNLSILGLKIYHR